MRPWLISVFCQLFLGWVRKSMQQENQKSPKGGISGSKRLFGEKIQRIPPCILILILRLIKDLYHLLDFALGIQWWWDKLFFLKVCTILTNQITAAPCLYFLNKFYHQHKIIYLKQSRPAICFLCMSKVARLNLVPPNQRMPWTQMSRAAICSQEGASPPPAAHICCSKRGKQTCNLRSYETTHSQGQNVEVLA